MPSNRIVYQNWIADLGRDPSLPPQPEPFWQDTSDVETRAPLSNQPNDLSAATPDPRRERIREAVRAALAQLSDDERELVEQIHFMGRTFREIAERSGRTEHRLEAMHARALLKLRQRLAPLVRELFGVTSSAHTDCPICKSPHRLQIDQVIRERDPDQTWRPVMCVVRTRFGLRLTTPQTLIGHEKYH